MIHWGNSIPCTLYIDNRKECDINLPDSASWEQITSEVCQKFNLTAYTWHYTLSDLGASQVITSEEHFRTIKENCVNTRQVLQLNVCTGTGSGTGNVAGQQVDESSSKFQLAVEAAVQKYLRQHGPELLRDLAHRSKLCCCNRNQRRAGCSSESGAMSPHLEVVQGDMVLDNSDSMFLGDPCPTPNSLQSPHASNSEVKSLPLYSSLLSNHNPTTPAPPPSDKTRKSNRDSSEKEVSSSKRAKVIPPDKEYILGPCKNSVVTVVPGTQVEVVWSLVVKQGVQSSWELVDEGGTIHPAGGAGVGTWSLSGNNIQEFTVSFTAPAVEGAYESKWTLKQDSIARESIVLCSMKVQSSAGSRETSALACHGNIPADISVPKLLNSNKVFCMSSEQMPSLSRD